MTKILYLYAEVMGYTMATLSQLPQDGVEVHVVYWDERKITPYEFPAGGQISFYARSGFNHGSLMELANQIDPDLVVVSGWEDFDYLRVSRKLVKAGKRVVCGFDDQWFGSLKQHIASIIGALGFFKLFYTHAWVCGVRQYEYARRLGFRKSEVIFDLYSADQEMFDTVYTRSAEAWQTQYPHTFLFVGRFEDVKGLDVLLAAWKSLGPSRKDWTLQLVGSGSLSSQFEEGDGVRVSGFMQPHELMDVVGDAGCFVLPSRFEPWGVVVHEFATAGMPLILSDAVGAGDAFLIDGHNGYCFKNESVEDLTNKLRKIIESPDEKLMSMARYSHAMSRRITPASSSSNLLSLIS